MFKKTTFNKTCLNWCEQGNRLFICTSHFYLDFHYSFMIQTKWVSVCERRKTFLFLCEEVFVNFQINYEYQIQIKWFIWVINWKGSVKSGAWKIAMSFIMNHSVLVRISYLSHIWCHTGLKLLSLNCNSCLLSLKFSCPRTRCGWSACVCRLLWIFGWNQLWVWRHDKQMCL